MIKTRMMNYEKILNVTLAFALLITVSTTVSAATPGAVAGTYYYTDIVTYLWDTPINSINIGGVTLIDAESMAYYGFEVNWYHDLRSLELIDLRTTKVQPEAANGSLLDMKSGKTGSAAGKYYYTDIITSIDHQEIISYNIGGRTFIGAEAMRDLNYEVSWNDTQRTLTISHPNEWSWGKQIVNDSYDYTTEKVITGFSYTFTKITEGDSFDFVISDSAYDYKAIPAIEFGGKGIGFSFYQHIREFGDFAGLLWDGVSINYGGRIAADTPEHRQALRRVLRVFINDKLVDGELYRSQGNGHSDYSFVFDGFYNCRDINTVRLELYDIGEYGGGLEGRIVSWE